MKTRPPKPFPLLCPECGKRSVQPIETDYTTKLGKRIITKRITINRCTECGGEILPNKALDELFGENIMNIWEAAKNAENVNEVLKLVENETPDDVVICLSSMDRWDLLQQLTEHDAYADLAEREIDLHQKLEQSYKDFEKQCQNYPEHLKQIREILKKSKDVGIFDVVYPSNIALQYGLGEKFFAISGDGLFLFAIEVINTNGEGQYKLQRSPTTTGPSDYEQKFLEMIGGQYDKPLTANMVIEVIKQLFHIQS
jgi:hypothetical protein